MAPLVAGLMAGCGNNTTGTAGGGGGGGGNPTKPEENKTSNTFRIKDPLLTPSIKQGERKIVELSLDRGSDFKQTIKVEVDAPKGLKVELPVKSFAPSEKGEFNINVEAEKDAPLGEMVIKVKGTPESGTPTTLNVKVNIEKP